MNTIVRDELARVLDGANAEYERIPHPRSLTALAEAAALGVEPAHVAKTLIVKTATGYVRAVLPAPERLDLHRVRDVLGDREAVLATEAELAGAYPMFELGAVPPFGGPAGDRVLVDLDIAAQDWVVLEAGAHDESLRVRTADLLRLTEGQVADICRE